MSSSGSAWPTSAADFAIAVSFADGRAVVRLQGDVDLVTSPAFSSVASALLRGGNRDVVIDLDDVDFFGASGLGIVAATAEGLRAIGGQLAVRSSSGLIDKLFAIAGISGMVRVEAQDATSVASPASHHDSNSAAADLARVVALPADVDVLDAALRLVAALALTITGADGVSITLARQGRLMTVAATDATVDAMDQDQYALGEGPCVEASRVGHWFVVDDADVEPRWPSFMPRVRDRGIGSILSTPLRGLSGPTGAINMYSFGAHAFADREQALAAAVAGHASDVLADAGADVRSEQVAIRLQDALRVRETIAQAQGVIMAQEGVTSEEAFSTLLRSSVESGLPLRDHAADVLRRLGGRASTSGDPNEQEASDF